MLTDITDAQIEEKYLTIPPKPEPKKKGIEKREETSLAVTVIKAYLKWKLPFLRRP